jgi:hypothetical protein
MDRSQFKDVDGEALLELQEEDLLEKGIKR